VHQGGDVSPAVAVLADDLTGANATGARFARMGLRTRTLTGSAAVLEDSLQSQTGEADVVVVTTGTRTMAPEEAATVVEELLRSAPRLAASPLLAKRIDTTLRGPIAAVLAVLRAARRRSGQRVAAVAVPAYPSAGRTTVDGVHLVNGVPLVETPAGRDPLTPVHSSRVAELLTTGIGLEADEVHLDVLRSGDEPALDAIARAVSTTDVVVLDAETEEELTRLATLVARARRQTGVDIVPVDSGPFVAAYCAALGLRQLRYDAPVLVIVGSTAEPTSRQLEHAVASLGLRIVEVDPEGDFDDLVPLTLRHATEGGRDICWRITTHHRELDARLAMKIPQALAAAARQVLQQAGFGGVFACGGEVAAALLDGLEVHSLEIAGEVLPLVVTGRVRGGPWDRLPVVTKGGLVGDDRAITASIGRLHEMHEGFFGTAEDRRHRSR
jgi:uncharacterized protein YgbK (DUF1537 family)